MAPESPVVRAARWSLCITIAALPLYTVRWHYGPLPTTLLETLTLITVALYVIGRWRGGMRRPLGTPYDLAVIALLVAGAVAVLVASDHRGALGLYRAYFLEPVALFYVAIDLLRRREHLQQLVVAFAAGSSAFAVMNLVVFYRALIANAVYVGQAPNALYGDANYVAMYLEPPFAIAAGLVILGRTARWRMLGAAWLLIVGAALVVTFSKGSYLAVCVLALVVVITVPRWRIPVLAGGLAAMIAVTQVPLMMARLATVSSSLNGRQELVSATLGMIRDHPIFGLGLGGYSFQFRGVTPEVYPHDMWLTFWVEIGVLGVAAFAYVFAALLWRGWRAWPATTGFERALLWGVLGSLVLWFVHGFVDSPYWKNDFSVEFWILAALQLVILRAVTSAAHAPRPERRPAAATAVTQDLNPV